MRQPRRVTSARFTNRFQARLAILIGVVILGGAVMATEEGAKTKASRKTASAKAYSLPPSRNFNRDAPGPPYPAFIPHSSASGEDLDFQKEVAKVLCEKAESYPGREEHFSWLVRHPLFQQAVHRVDGLSGYIIEAKRLPDGAWRARVHVRPSVGAAGIPYIADYILEDYQYQNGVLTLLQTDAAVPKPDKQVFILH